jgi:hypothetical protein
MLTDVSSSHITFQFRYYILSEYQNSSNTEPSISFFIISAIKILSSMIVIQEDVANFAKVIHLKYVKMANELHTK